MACLIDCCPIWEGMPGGYCRTKSRLTRYWPILLKPRVFISHMRFTAAYLTFAQGVANLDNRYPSPKHFWCFSTQLFVMSNLALGAISAIGKMPTGFLSCYKASQPQARFRLEMATKRNLAPGSSSARS